MAGMSVGGLVSGMDTATIVSQLMQIEANPQTLLKQQLSAAEAKATAYRAINTRFDALRTAAEALTKPAAWQAVKASTNSPAATASAAAGAAAGSRTFAVDRLAAAHSVISAARWTVTGTQTPADVAYGSDSISVTSGGTTTTIPVTGTSGTPSLADAVKAVNGSGLGLTASAVKVSETEYRLQITATATGAAKEFTVDAPGAFDVATQGQDAQLTVGTGPAKYTMTSATNTFTGLLDGTTVTVTDEAPEVTLTVAEDPQAVAAKVTALVAAANGLLEAISSYTRADSTSAALKGDATLRQFAGRILDTVSRSVGSDGSLAVAGLELSKDGKLEFDAATFEAKLTADPELAQRLFAGTVTTDGVDGLPGTPDDVTTPTGVAGRLAAIATAAADTTTGALTLLAASKDTAAKDLQSRIDAWDLRLELRRTALTRQFTAMETALSSLQNQSSWLSAQLATLPSWSKSES